MATDDITFQRRMRKLIRTNGGLRQLARQTGIDSASLSRYSKDGVYPGFFVLQRLGRNGVDLNYLVLGRRKNG